jgi:2-hydroxychromene-2-carboxylate isomerase
VSSDPTVECFFDCSSPWSYLAFHNLGLMAARLGFTVDWRPILVGGVFNKVNTAIYAMRADPPALKAAYMGKDLQNWADYSGVTLRFPPACGHPVNSVTCMRACIVAMDQGRLTPFATAAFETLWAEGRDLADPAVLADICRQAGLAPDATLGAAVQPQIKDRLRDATEELMARGGYGAPTIYVGRTDMYFGNDRLPLVERAILRARGEVVAKP